MSAQLLTSDGTALGNPHFYFGRGVSGDDLRIMQDRRTVSRPAGSLWERLQDRTDMDSEYAKSVVLSDAYTFNVARGFSKLNNEQMVRISHGIGFRGMPVAEAPEAYRSGRIIAGVLHGNRVSAPYEPTPTHRTRF